MAFVLLGPSRTEAQVTWQNVSSHRSCNPQETEETRLRVII